MKKLTASTLRNLLSVLLVVAAVLVVVAFIFGYRYLQTVQEDTTERQQAAAASTNSVNQLQHLQLELERQSDAIQKLTTLRTTNTLPQFDTEHSLRTIARQLNLPIQNINFTGSGGGTEEAAEAAPTTAWSGPRNSRVSFGFGRSISYNELIRFLHAVETSTPKLRLDGITLPDESSSSRIDAGTLTIEMATQ